jgi:hypothetical protein
MNCKKRLDEDHDGSRDGDSCAGNSTALEVGSTADEDWQRGGGLGGNWDRWCGGRDWRGSGSGSGDSGDRDHRWAGRVDNDGCLGNFLGGARDDDGESGFLAGGCGEFAFGPGLGGCASDGDPFSCTASDGRRAPLADWEGGGVVWVEGRRFGRRIGGLGCRGRSNAGVRCWCGGRAGVWCRGGHEARGWATSSGEAGEEEGRCSKSEFHFRRVKVCKASVLVKRMWDKNECQKKREEECV